MKRKLLFAVALATGALGTLRAQAWEDVTATYITNADFSEGTALDNKVCTYSKDMDNNSTTYFGMQAVTGWTASDPSDNVNVGKNGSSAHDTKASAVFAVNSGYWVGGSAHTVPTTNSTGAASGNVLGIVGVWGGAPQYMQASKTELAAGTYLYVADVYNSNPTKFLDENLIGVQVDGSWIYSTSASYAQTWTKCVVKFTVAEAGTVNFSLGLKGNAGTANSEALFFDSVKLYYASTDVTADKTSKITNPKAETGDITGWTATGSNANEAKKVNVNTGFDGAKYFFEPSAWNDASWNSTISQTVTGLPEGFYKVQAAAQVSSGVTAYITANNSRSAKFPANGTSNGTIAADGSVVAAGSGVAGWNYCDVTTYVGVDGNLAITAYSTASAKQNWANFDNFTLTFIGDELAAYKASLASARAAAQTALDNPTYSGVTGVERTNLSSAISSTASVEETQEALEAAYTAVNEATATFTSAVATYDLLASEKTYATSIGMTSDAINTAAAITKTGLVALQDLKVAEYTYVSDEFPQDFTSTYLATPTTNTFDALDAQHWSGQTHSYFDFWNGGSADRALTYTITLPEGKYMIKAAGRGQANTESRVSISDGTTTVNFTMKGDNGLGINKAGVTSFDPSDAAGFANNNNGRGWEWRYLLINLDEETELTLSLNGHVNNSWIGACDFALLTTADNSAINKAAYNTALAAAEAARDDASYSNVTGKEKTDLLSAIATDVSAGTPSVYDTAKAAIESATEAFIAAKSAYDSYASFYAQASALKDVENTNSSANETYAAAVTANAVSSSTTAASLSTMISSLRVAASSYVAVADPTENNQFDLTFMLDNADVSSLWTGAWHVHPTGWANEQDGGNFQVMQNNDVDAADGVHKVFMEYYYLADNKTYDNGKFNIYTKATLPVGTYTMTCYAFAKEQNYSSGAANPQVYFYANDTQGSLVNTSTLTEQSISFVNATEQEVKIGLKPLTGNTYNWMGIGYVKLYKVPEQVYAISENETYDNSQSGAGKVTLTRTIKAEKYNTIVLPFAANTAAIEAIGGTGAKAYTVLAFANDNVTFTEVASVPANEPFLLYATAENDGSEAIDLGEQTIVAGTPSKTVGNITFTGSYASSAKATEGSYVVSNNNLYLVDSDVTIKGTRAYFTVAASAKARVLSMTFDGDATGIATIGADGVNVETGVIYNLNGQRVAAPQKGIYIVNGKKVLFK